MGVEERYVFLCGDVYPKVPEAAHSLTAELFYHPLWTVSANRNLQNRTSTASAAPYPTRHALRQSLAAGLGDEAQVRAAALAAPVDRPDLPAAFHGRTPW